MCSLPKLLVKIPSLVRDHACLLYVSVRVLVSQRKCTRQSTGASKEHSRIYYLTSLPLYTYFSIYNVYIGIVICIRDSWLHVHRRGCLLKILTVWVHDQKFGGDRTRQQEEAPF